MYQKIIIVAASLFALSACNTSTTNHTSKPQLIGGKGNPASINCIEKGGKLNLVKQADGGTIGMCSFRNGKTCEEWALFRGECAAE